MFDFQHYQSCFLSYATKCNIAQIDSVVGGTGTNTGIEKPSHIVHIDTQMHWYNASAPKKIHSKPNHSAKLLSVPVPLIAMHTTCKAEHRTLYCSNFLYAAHLLFTRGCQVAAVQGSMRLRCFPLLLILCVML